MIWWDDDKVEAVVTRDFVCSRLIPSEIARLDEPLGFGDGLTDGTYWEWLQEKSKKIFLILVELDMPDQIFGIIDDSWDDDDLPIALDQVERLDLTARKDDKVERRFYYAQFHYLLRLIKPGEHTIYSDCEVVPIEHLDKIHGGMNHAIQVDKVGLPNAPGRLLSRRRIPLGDGPGCMTHEQFLSEVTDINAIQNQHIVSYYASYSHQGYGYVLLSPVADCTLKSFLTNPPSSTRLLEKHARRRLIMDWIHCLADTMCYIHKKGLAFNNIRPSTILINTQNHIFLSDFGRLNSENLASGGSDITFFNKEVYDYNPPEQWFKPTTSGVRRATLMSMSSAPNTLVFSISRSNTNLSSMTPSGNPYDTRPMSPQALMNASTPSLNPQAADIFSFGCIILELLSHLLKRKPGNFASHRSAKHKAPGRGGAVLDSSFHKNLGQIETWMSGLGREALKKKDEPIFRGIVPLLHVVERMLAYNPHERPSAFDVQTRLYQILTETCGIAQPHCVHHYENFDFGLGSLRLGSPAKPTPTTSVPTTASAERDASADQTPSRSPSINNVVPLSKTLTENSSGSGSNSNADTVSTGGTKRSSVWSQFGHRRTDSDGSGGGGSGSIGGASSIRGHREPGTIPAVHAVAHMQTAPSPWFYSKTPSTRRREPSTTTASPPNSDQYSPPATTSSTASTRASPFFTGANTPSSPRASLPSSASAPNMRKIHPDTVDELAQMFMEDHNRSVAAAAVAAVAVSPPRPHRTFGRDDDDDDRVYHGGGDHGGSATAVAAIPRQNGAGTPKKEREKSDRFELGSGLKAIRDLRL